MVCRRGGCLAFIQFMCKFECNFILQVLLPELANIRFQYNFMLRNPLKSRITAGIQAIITIFLASTC